MNEHPQRPYAAPANLLSLLRRFRTRNLPEEEGVTPEFTRASGIPPGAVGRTISALRFLSLIDEIGYPTDTLRALARSTDEDYRIQLDQIVRNAYREDFTVVDPSVDPQVAIINAFRRYEPASQHTRMVMLFLGLCREAGIPTVDAPRQRGMRTISQTRGTSQKRQPTPQPPPRPISPISTVLPPIPQTVVGVLHLLPAQPGPWKADEKERFLAAFGAVVHATYPDAQETNDIGN